MVTVANVKQSDSSHWYYKEGLPCYELPKKDGTGMKVPTLADARKLNLVPSVTTILKVLDKPGLNEWRIEQAVLAVMTSPHLPGEAEDAFIVRVLKQTREQDEEVSIARDKGKEIHTGFETLCRGEKVEDETLLPYLMPAWEKLTSLVEPLYSEFIIVGPGYAGKSDFLGVNNKDDGPGWKLLADFKSTRRLPDKGSYPEHRLQLAAYAKGYHLKTADTIKTANVYVSTAEPGKFEIFMNPPWRTDYEQGFAPLITHWQWLKGYVPLQ